MRKFLDDDRWFFSEFSENFDYMIVLFDLEAEIYSMKKARSMISIFQTVPLDNCCCLTEHSRNQRY